MGVAELLSWGVPPILVLLHLVLVHHLDCPDDEAWFGCMYLQYHFAKKKMCSIRPWTLQSFSVVRLPYQTRFGLSGAQFDSFLDIL